MDIWASGCVLYELVTLNPLFPGKTELDQINRIHAVLGTPTEKLLAYFRSKAHHHLHTIRFRQIKGTGLPQKLTQYSPDVASLIHDLLTYDPTARPSASQALRHRLFESVRETRHDSPATVSSSPREPYKLGIPQLSFKSPPTLHPLHTFSNPYSKPSPRIRSKFSYSPPGGSSRLQPTKNAAAFVLASARRAHV
jgi:serine/threonine protein kinase